MILGLLFVIFSVVAVLRLGWGLVYGSRQEALEAARVFLPLAAAAVGLPLIIWRLVILNRQTRTAEEKTQIDRETHYTSIFSKSVEQLGATREQKEVPDGQGTTEAVSRTVPNIEVRLGGLHSLVRLAEESTRDALKIERMFSSYIRENSWFSRSGSRSQNPPNDSIPHFHQWYHRGLRSKDSDRADDYLNKWRSDVDNIADSIRSWAEGLTETRVDVAEALSNLASIFSPQSVAPEIYESLFVEQVFMSNQVGGFKFRRCSFVRCKFYMAGDDFYQLENCLFVGCTFNVGGMRINFYGCKIIDGSISNVSGGNMHVDYSSIINLRGLASFDGATLHAFGSTFKDARLYGEGFLISAKQSSFTDCDFDRAVFTAASSIESSSFVASTVKEADLSAISSFETSALEEMIASPTTLHPGEVRPTSWPPYDPDYVDDDIPF
jgi:uncharacterized protein YjbI with pentapeptide repeats